MDTPLVNGTAYPYLEVQPQTYRFRILNAANDRFFNLQLYVADNTTVTADGSGQLGEPGQKTVVVDAHLIVSTLAFGEIDAGYLHNYQAHAAAGAGFVWVDRGDPMNRTNDVGAMELYASPVITNDPFRVIDALRARFAEP